MNRGRSIILVVVALLCFSLTAVQNGRLVRLRGDYRVSSAAPLENTTPLLAFTTVAFGGFSTLLADILWLRVSTLQDEGRYFELVQLAEWITKLEPRSGEIWEFHSWNMAYNVSIMMPDHEDRWRWVRNGIELLRNEGIRYNAGDAKIYWQLGWLFLDKVGSRVDQSREFYRAKLAEEMTALLGGGHPDYARLREKTGLPEKIRGEYGMDIDLMQRIDRDYGPVDWTLPESHSLYWAVSGMEHGSADPTLLCQRLMLQSLRMLMIRGNRVTGSDGKPVFSADLSMCEKVNRAHEAALRSHPKNTLLAHSHAAFMVEAMRVLHEAGRETEAMEWFRTVSERYPSPITAQGYDALVQKK